MPLSATGEQAISDLFHLIDKNNNKVIDLKEQRKAKKKLHSLMMPKGRWRWTEMDTDGDGMISMIEWRAAMQAIADKAGEEHLLWGIITAWNDHPLAVEIRKIAGRSESKRLEELRIRLDSKYEEKKEEARLKAEKEEEARLRAQAIARLKAQRAEAIARLMRKSTRTHEEDKELLALIVAEQTDLGEMGAQLTSEQENDPRQVGKDLEAAIRWQTLAKIEEAVDALTDGSGWAQLSFDWERHLWLDCKWDKLFEIVTYLIAGFDPAIEVDEEGKPTDTFLKQAPQGWCGAWRFISSYTSECEEYNGRRILIETARQYPTHIDNMQVSPQNIEHARAIRDSMGDDWSADRVRATVSGGGRGSFPILAALAKWATNIIHYYDIVSSHV
jgi:hypothetical protein